MNGGTLKQTVLALTKAESTESNLKETRKSKFGLSVILTYPTFVEPEDNQP